MASDTISILDGSTFLVSDHPQTHDRRGDLFSGWGIHPWSPRGSSS